MWQTIDGDIVTIVFVLVLLILTFKKYRHEHRVTRPGRKIEQSLPNYPGVPESLLVSLTRGATAAPPPPPPLPTTPAEFSQADASRIAHAAVRHLQGTQPSMDISLIFVDRVTCHRDGDGVKYWTLSAMIHERVHAMSIKINVHATTTPPGDAIRVQTIRPQFDPVHTASSPPPMVCTKYAPYSLPIPTI